MYTHEFIYIYIYVYPSYAHLCLPPPPFSGCPGAVFLRRFEAPGARVRRCWGCWRRCLGTSRAWRRGLPGGAGYGHDVGGSSRPEVPWRGLSFGVGFWSGGPFLPQVQLWAKDLRASPGNTSFGWGNCCLGFLAAWSGGAGFLLVSTLATNQKWDPPSRSCDLSSQLRKAFLMAIGHWGSGTSLRHGSLAKFGPIVRVSLCLLLSAQKRGTWGLGRDQRWAKSSLRCFEAASNSCHRLQGSGYV